MIARRFTICILASFGFGRARAVRRPRLRALARADACTAFLFCLFVCDFVLYDTIFFRWSAMGIGRGRNLWPSAMVLTPTLFHTLRSVWEKWSRRMADILVERNSSTRRKGAAMRPAWPASSVALFCHISSASEASLRWTLS